MKTRQGWNLGARTDELCVPTTSSMIRDQHFDAWVQEGPGARAARGTAVVPSGKGYQPIGRMPRLDRKTVPSYVEEASNSGLSLEGPSGWQATVDHWTLDPDPGDTWLSGLRVGAAQVVTVPVAPSSMKGSGHVDNQDRQAEATMGRVTCGGAPYRSCCSTLQAALELHGGSRPRCHRQARRRPGESPRCGAGGASPLCAARPSAQVQGVAGHLEGGRGAAVHLQHQRIRLARPEGGIVGGCRSGQRSGPRRAIRTRGSRFGLVPEGAACELSHYVRSAGALRRRAAEVVCATR